MTWLEEVDQQLGNAIRANDLDTFARLLRDNPDNLRAESAREKWLHLAAQKGRLAIVEYLVVNKLIDINEPVGDSNPDRPISTAASFGHLDVVRWLFEHGAPINFACDQLPIDIRPLTGAAIGGHLDVVKFLVENGADFDTPVGGMNALMHAGTYGHEDVVEYLKSLGSRDVREWMPKDFPASHNRMRQDMISLYGPLSDFRLEVAGSPPFEICATVPHKENGVQTVFTIGLSDRELKGANEVKIETEIKLFLPREWPVSEETLNNPRWNWPIRWLRKIAREALDSGTWAGGWSAVFMNGDPPQSLVPDTQLCGWLCLLHHGASYQMPDARWIDDRTMFPIYAEEKALIDKEGYEELVKRFHVKNFPQHIDPHRPSTVDPAA